MPYDMPGYSTPMDRAYHERVQTDPTRPQYKLETPIAPVSRIGQTIPEEDRMHGGSMLQGVQAAIRGGAGAIQLVLTVPHNAPFGGRPHAMGKEFRQALKETIMANEIMFAGVEMPTSSLTNLSGFDGRTGLSEEVRKQNIQEIKNAIEFVADIGQGGGVDAIAFEFPRALINPGASPWNTMVKEKGPDGKEVERPLFYEYDPNAEKKTEPIMVVNPDTGKIQSIPVGAGIDLHLDPKTGKPTETANAWTWDDLMRRSKEDNRPPYEYVLHDVIEQRSILSNRELDRAKLKVADQKHDLKQAEQHLQDAEKKVALIPKFEEGIKRIEQDLPKLSPQERAQAEEYLGELRHQKEQAERAKSDRDWLAERIPILKKSVETEDAALPGIEAEALKERREIEKLQPFEKEAKSRTMQSYAEAGLHAMGESARKNLKEAVFVGPEISWPQFYGSHPDEFIEIIEGARKKMAEQLRAEGYSDKAARAEATKHIRGTMDTSHLGMWFKHFHPAKQPGEKEGQYEDRRKKEFNKWYLDQVTKIAKADVIGNIQLVDSRGGEHGHLPPGEGELPIREAALIFKNAGFAGPWISEGHDEERFQLGRIRTSAWKTLGANINPGGYTPGGGQVTRWGDVYNAYMGKSYSPTKMVGMYAPNAEFRMWSEVPLE